MRDPDDSSPRLFKNRGIHLGAIALGLTTLMFPIHSAISQEIENGVVNVTSEDLIQDAESHIGELVTIRNVISKKIGTSGFLLSEDNDSEPIIVINPTGETITPPSDDIPIQVTGKVARLVITDVETEYGIDLEDDLYADYVDRPVIIAESLALAPRPEQIAANPADFYDKVVAVEGDVRQLLSNNTLTIFEEGWVDDVGLLVISVKGDFTVDEDRIDPNERIVVTGVARKMEDIRMLNQEYGLGWDEAKIAEFEARYSPRPVIMADGVYPSALDN